MNKLQASSNVLSNGDVAVEMIYNNKSHAKKLIIFFMVAIVMAAIAFSACFFALEISRTNAYNNRLNNSIVEPSQETPPEINPTTPENNNSTTDNNEPGGSASDEGENGVGAGEIHIHAVWADNSTPMNIDAGIAKAAQKGFIINLHEHKNPVNYQSSHMVGLNATDGLGWSKNTVMTVQLPAGSENGGMFAFMEMDSYGTFKISTDLSFSKLNDYGHNTSGSGDGTPCLTIGSPTASYILESKKGSFYSLMESVSKSGVGKQYYVVYTEMISLNLYGFPYASPEFYLCPTDPYASDVSCGTDTLINLSLDSIWTYNAIGYFGGGTFVFKNNSFNNFWAWNYYFNSLYDNYFYVASPDAKSPGSNQFVIKVDDVYKTYQYRYDNYYHHVCVKFKDTETLKTYNPTNVKNIYNGFYLNSKLFNVVYKGGVYCTTESSHIAKVTVNGSSYYCYTTEHVYDAVRTLAGKETVIKGYDCGALSMTEIGLNWESPFKFEGYQFEKYTIKTPYNTTFNLGNKGYKSSVIIQKANTVDFNSGNYADINLENCDAYIYGCTINGNLNCSNENDCVWLDGCTLNGEINRYKNSLILIADDFENSNEININLENVDESASDVLYDNETDNCPVFILQHTNNPISININRSLISGTYKILRLLGAFSIDENGNIKNSGGNDAGYQINLNGNAGKFITSVSGAYTTISVQIENVYKITSYNSTANWDNDTSTEKSFLWMLACERGEISGISAGSLAYTYQLQCDITIPEGTATSYFTGFGMAAPFSGVFDGNGFKITFTTGNMGLFYKLQNAVVKNLILDGYIDKPYTGSGGVNYYYGLAYEVLSSARIFNLYNNLRIRNPSTDTGPAVGCIYKNNEASLSFINCYVRQSVENYTGTATEVHERSSFLGYNYSGTVHFENCVASEYRDTYKTTPLTGNTNISAKNGVFVGWNCNINAYGDAIIVFDNCYKLGYYNYSGGGYSHNNPVVGADGIYNSSTGTSTYDHIFMAPALYEYNGSAEIPEDISQMSGKVALVSASDLGGVEKYLNNWNKIKNNLLYGQSVYDWLNGYLLLFPSINSQEELLSVFNGTDMSLRAMRLTSSFTLNNWGSTNNYINKFYGYLDGNGKVINMDYNCQYPLVYENHGTIENLTIYGEISRSSMTAGFAVYNQGTIESCINRANITGETQYNSHGIGGIASINNGKIRNCDNYGTVKVIKNNYTIAENVGGIVGYMNNSGAQLQGCSNFGKVIGVSSVGGLIGYLYDGFVSLDYQKVECEIEGTNTVGGVAGYVRDGVSISVGREFVCIVNITVNSGGSMIGGLYGYGSAKNQVVSATITVKDANLPTYFGLITGWGSATSCVFMGTVKDSAGNLVNLASGATSGVPITGRGSATRCFVQSDSTKILNTPTTITGVTYTGCSTFKDASTSLMYNGARFGYLVDALSGRSDGTDWSIENNQLIYEQYVIKKYNNTLTISEIDNLEAINDMVVDNNVSHSFNLYTLKFTADFNLYSDFAGLGDDSHSIIGGTWDASGAEINLTNTTFFNKISNATLSGFIFNGTSNKSCISNAIDTIFNNCIINVNITDVSTQGFIGGLVAKANGCSFTNCVNNGAIQSSYSAKIGGIVGNSINCDFTNCINNGTILNEISNAYVGGICATATSSKFENCTNNGYLLTTSNSSLIGGIIAKTSMTQSNYCEILKCTNYGNLRASGTDSIVGGIVGSGYEGSSRILNCYVNANIFVESGILGGVLGESYGILTNNISEGIFTLNGEGNLAGIAANGGGVNNCVSFAVLRSNSSTALVAGLGSTNGTNELGIAKSYFFGDILALNYYVVANIGFDNIHCGYNINNIKFSLDKVLKDERINWYIVCYDEIDDLDKNVYYKSGENVYELATVLEFYKDRDNLYYKNASGEFIHLSNVDEFISDYLLWINENSDLEEGINYQDFEDLIFPELIYVKDNPVWSSSAYIKMLFKTETETMLNGTNSKLELNWYDTDTATTGIQSGYDISFWSSVFAAN